MTSLTLIFSSLEYYIRLLHDNNYVVLSFLICLTIWRGKYDIWFLVKNIKKLTKSRNRHKIFLLKKWNIVEKLTPYKLNFGCYAKY